ncbi:MAG: bifunctional adenosylcobinamide kinase/adenosylcobinamide-phosphate guanylyltransferase, partial [Desulfarculaceae bacterium]
SMSEHALILGGAKSGKSSFALSLAEQGDYARRVFIATAEAKDPEMARRIQRHQAERGPDWSTLEEPLELVPALKKADRPDSILLVDCLTLWLSNLMTVSGLSQSRIEDRFEDLIQTLPNLQGDLILVSNEVGMGIVPGNALSRSFRDLAGGLNRRLAQVCQKVVLVTAGLPLVLKGPKM